MFAIMLSQTDRGLSAIVCILAGVFVFIVLQVFYLVIVLLWADRRTSGANYYGQPRARRQRYKRILRWHARLLGPTLLLLSRVSHFSFQKVTFVYRGVPGPKGTCSPESFARACRFQPGPDDVFVVTQMRCGTTWMQHLVMQVLLRGNGQLADSGIALYAVSPWLESTKTLDVESAPSLGIDRPSRIIKTHLPIALCPYNEQARYIYVVRHPVSCFASCVDFLHSNLGRFSPPLEEFEQWYCADALMWWNTWPVHVAGWYQRAKQCKNVLFVRFEDMTRDFEAVVNRVTEFLGLPSLAVGEHENVIQRCSFNYMQQHADVFEMQPPHLLQTDAQFFVSGAADRHKVIPSSTAERILVWSEDELSKAGLSLNCFYPDAVELDPSL